MGQIYQLISYTFHVSRVFAVTSACYGPCCGRPYFLSIEICISNVWLPTMGDSSRYSLKYFPDKAGETGAYLPKVPHSLEPFSRTKTAQLDLFWYQQQKRPSGNLLWNAKRMCFVQFLVNNPFQSDQQWRREKWSGLFYFTWLTSSRTESFFLLLTS